MRTTEHLTLKILLKSTDQLIEWRVPDYSRQLHRTSDRRDSCEDGVMLMAPSSLRVSQQHGTSHGIERYHIILIREMCWKAISSSNKWPSAQQKPEESHLCRQRLCHEKSLILNPLTCHRRSKGPLRKEGATERERESKQGREEGVTQGEVWGTLWEKRGTGVTPAPLSQKRGPVKGRPRQPSPLLAGTMWSSPLPLSSFTGALF